MRGLFSCHATERTIEDFIKNSLKWIFHATEHCSIIHDILLGPSSAAVAQTKRRDVWGPFLALLTGAVRKEPEPPSQYFDATFIFPAYSAPHKTSSIFLPLLSGSPKSHSNRFCSQISLPSFISPLQKTRALFQYLPAQPATVQN